MFLILNSLNNSCFEISKFWHVTENKLSLIYLFKSEEIFPISKGYRIPNIGLNENPVKVFTHIPLNVLHSVESPSMVDPQWNIWYWRSKWNLHTICSAAVGCEWGTTSVYFWITYVCFIPGRLPVFAVEAQYRLQYFLFLSKVSFEGHIQNLVWVQCVWYGGTKA